jgi:hypothetical protein
MKEFRQLDPSIYNHDISCRDSCHPLRGELYIQQNPIAIRKEYL